MHTYYIWITAITNLYEDSLLAQLVKRGYWVRSSSPDHSISNTKPGSPSTLIAITIESKDQLDVTSLWHIVAEILETIRGKYYSLIVSEKAGCAWSVGNINLDQIKANPYKAILN